MSAIQTTGRRALPTPDAPEVRLVATARQRLQGRLDLAVDDPPEDPSIAEVVEVAKGYGHARSWMIGGGEPTLRADFPQLIRALSDAGAPELGLITDGLALTSAKVPAMLVELGLTRVRIHLMGARHDAHDWIVGHTGAWRRAVKAVRGCVEAGLAVEVVCTVTRPTRPYLEESVELFARLGAEGVVLRRITARGPAALNDVAVAPRWGLMQKDLEKAVQIGTRAGMAMRVEGFPLCVVPAVKAAVLPEGAVVWALPSTGAWAFLGPRFEAPVPRRGCGRCPGPPACVGPPSDYLVRFGHTELDSESVARVHPGEIGPTPLEGGDVYPPPRAGRFPPTRVSYVRLAARLPSLGGDPLAALRTDVAPPIIRTLFAAPSRVADPVLGDRPGAQAPESTRDVRVRIVQLAQHGASVLRIASAGSLAHPDAAELLRECTRLQLPRIEVAGEGSALSDFTDMQLRRLRGITRLDVALYGPDPESHDAVVGVDGAFDAALAGLDRLASLVPSMQVGAYAVLRDPAHVAEFVEAWDLGDLPGDPWFRLSPTGGDLRALAEIAGEVAEGAARDALAAVLPKALLHRPDRVAPAPEATFAWGDLPDDLRKPSGSDRVGCYTDRPASGWPPPPGHDPGIAEGWTLAG